MSTPTADPTPADYLAAREVIEPTGADDNLVEPFARAIAGARAYALVGVCPCAPDLAAVGVHDSFVCPIGVARGAL